MSDQELDDRCRKGVVGVTYDHMRRACDIGIFCMRGDLHEMGDGFFRDKVAGSAANEVERKG
jgi:hypothetical protein